MYPIILYYSFIQCSWNVKVFQKFNSQFCRVTTRTLLSSTLTSGITAKISGRNVSNITDSSGVSMCPPPSGRSPKSSAEDPPSGTEVMNHAYKDYNQFLTSGTAGGHRSKCRSMWGKTSSSDNHFKGKNQSLGLSLNLIFSRAVNVKWYKLSDDIFRLTYFVWYDVENWVGSML